MIDTVELRTGVFDNLRWITAQVHSKQIEDDEDGEVAASIEDYTWELRVTVVLADGEVRHAWSSGEYDEDLRENLPAGSLCVPLGTEVVVRVEGQLTVTISGLERTIAFDQICREGTAPLALATTFTPTVPTARSVEPVVTAIPGVPAGARIVATLPELGLVEQREGSYWLHTPRHAVELHGLEALVAKFAGYRREHAGGARGRLAIYSSRDSVERVAIVEVFEHGAIRSIHGSSTIASELGCFDATGSLYVGWDQPVETKVDANTSWFERRTVVFDCDAVALREGWSVPLLHTSRWYIDREMLAGVHYSRLHRAPAGQREVSTTVWTTLRTDPAYHPAPDVTAWLQGHTLETFHPLRGARQTVLPGGGSIAVLRDGRVLVAGDRLFVVGDDVVDLGPIGSYMARLEVIETDRITLWTKDPRRWRVEIP